MDWRVVKAPMRSDVLWANMMPSDSTKATWATAANAFVSALIVFWAVPVAFFSSLSNLQVSATPHAHAHPTGAVHRICPRYCRSWSRW
jgi:hypothetical protein